MDHRIRHALDRIHRAYGEPLSVDALARGVNLSRSRFTHLFRLETGAGPGRYVRDHRLERARVLLCTTALSVKEVMAAVGFGDPSHFTRDFRRRFGVSPVQFRAAEHPRADEPFPIASNGAIGQ